MPSTQYPAADYLHSVAAAVASIPVEPLEQLADDLMEAWRSRRFIFTCGNGGSAANAAHIVEDIGKCTIPEGAADFPRFRMLSLADSAPYLLAWANDDGFDRVFVEQLANLASPGDVLLAISTSGHSRNVLLAADWARQHGLVTWALTGCRESPLLELADHALQVPSDDVGIIETAHLAVTHWLVEHLRARLRDALRAECQTSRGITPVRSASEGTDVERTAGPGTSTSATPPGERHAIETRHAATPARRVGSAEFAA
jgi:D-sedoheptulose 7-phosphate isomerase